MSTNVCYPGSQPIYLDDANMIYKELKEAVLAKINHIKRQKRAPCDTSFQAIGEYMNEIMNLQSNYIKNEKNRNELIHKLRETAVKQNNTCDEMLK